MSNDQRQHYKLATGQSLDKTPQGKHPGYKRGGKIAMKKSMPVRKSGRGR